MNAEEEFNSLSDESKKDLIFAEGIISIITEHFDDPQRMGRFLLAFAAEAIYVTQIDVDDFNERLKALVDEQNEALMDAADRIAEEMH